MALAVTRSRDFTAEDFDFLRAEEQKAPDWNDPRWWGGGSQVSISGMAVTRDRVLQLGAVQAVLTSLSGSIKQLPFMVFRKSTDADGNEIRTPLPDHPAVELMEKPNREQVTAEFIGQAVRHIAYDRNAYAIIRGDASNPLQSLEQVNPTRVLKVERRADGFRYYHIQRLDRSGADIYRDDEIWHVRCDPLSRDGLVGQPIWETAREVFGRALSVKHYGDIWFRNFGGVGGVLEHPGSFPDKEKQREFIDNWRQQSVGENRARDRLLTQGAKYTVLKVTNAEAQLLETENRSDTEIFGLWNFPPHRASRLDRATNNNIEQQAQDYVVHSVVPIVVPLEQGIVRDLILDDEKKELCAEFNLAGLLRGDLLSRYRAMLIGRQGEWLSANDVRRFERMNPRTDPAGDTYNNPNTGSHNGSDIGNAGGGGNGNGGGGGGD